MLRRLALCFLLPNHKQHVALINELNETLPNRIQPLNHRLQVAYKYFAAWKVSDHSGSHSSHSATSDGANVRSANLDLALHSLDRHLRATALLIDSIRAEENKASLRNQLSHECKAVATCWELVEMEFIKSTGPRQTSSQSAQETAPLARRNEPADHGDAVPLCGPWEPDVEDLEILEADLENEPYERLARSDDDDDLFMLRETRQERLARKREMAAQSRRLYSELQVVLKSKAQEWKEREARVMERLGKPIEQEVAIEEEPRDALRTPHAEEASPTGKDDANDARSPMPIEQRARVDAKFDTTGVPASNFSVQASLAAQVRALASQRTVQHEDLIGDSDDAESTDSYVTEDD